MEYLEIECEVILPRNGPDRYRVYHNGGVLLDVCHDPLPEAAREFVNRGADMDARIVLYGRADGKERISARLGYAARI